MKTLRRRGAAAVELSITMVVLVPLVFFTIFLEDFAYYRLEGQEPTVAAISDLIVPDYMKKMGSDKVQHPNRLKYCDHSAAYDSYDRDFECDGTGSSGGGGSAGLGATGGAPADLGHHHATGAHACWLGAQELTCTATNGNEKNINVGAMGGYQSGWHGSSGTTYCSSQLNVFNAIIPRKPSTEGGWLWGKKSLTDHKQFGKAGGGVRDGAGGSTSWDQDEGYGISNVHSDGTGEATNNQGGDEQGNWLMTKEELYAVSDPWALSTIKDVTPHVGGTSPAGVGGLGGLGGGGSGGPGGGGLGAFGGFGSGSGSGSDDPHPLQSRTQHFYQNYGKDPASTGMDWEDSMVQLKMLNDNAGKDTLGDNLKSVPVEWKTARDRGNNGGYASGYQDSRQRSFSRGNSYPY